MILKCGIGGRWRRGVAWSGGCSRVGWLTPKRDITSPRELIFLICSFIIRGQLQILTHTSITTVVFVFEIIILIYDCFNLVRSSLDKLFKEQKEKKIITLTYLLQNLMRRLSELFYWIRVATFKPSTHDVYVRRNF